jgi:hypothetical protein
MPRTFNPRARSHRRARQLARRLVQGVKTRVGVALFGPGPAVGPLPSAPGHAGSNTCSRSAAPRGKAKSRGLYVADLHFDHRGLGVTIRRSKADQEGEGCEIGVPIVAKRGLCAASPVREWLAAAGIVAGPVFRTLTLYRTLTANRIDPNDVARLVKRATGAAGIEGTFAGHSLRAGFITAVASTQGVFEADIQRVGAPIGHDPAQLRSACERLRGRSALSYPRLKRRQRQTICP